MRHSRVAGMVGCVRSGFRGGSTGAFTLPAWEPSYPFDLACPLVFQSALRFASGPERRLGLHSTAPRGLPLGMEFEDAPVANDPSLATTNGWELLMDRQRPAIGIGKDLLFRFFLSLLSPAPRIVGSPTAIASFCGIALSKLLHCASLGKEPDAPPNKSRCSISESSSPV